MRQREHQSGFSTTLVLLAVLVVAVLAVTGLVVYQHHKPSSTKNSAATNQTQTTTQPMGTTTTQATTQYLDIKEWGVNLPLSDTIKDAYYTVGGNHGSDGLPNTMWLGLTSLNSSGCNATNQNSPSFKPVGSIIRVLPTDTDPVSGTLYTQLDPDGVTINGHYYAYAPWKNKTCASATTLQSIDSAFSTAAKGTVTATAN